jgi:hypothetical protein
MTGERDRRRLGHERPRRLLRPGFAERNGGRGRLAATEPPGRRRARASPAGEAILNLVDVRAAAMRTRPGYYAAIAVPVPGTDAHDVYESGPVATPAEAMILYGEAVHALVDDGTLARVADAPWRVFAVDRRRHPTQANQSRGRRGRRGDRAGCGRPTDRPSPADLIATSRASQARVRTRRPRASFPR